MSKYYTVYIFIRKIWGFVEFEYAENVFIAAVRVRTCLYNNNLLD